MKFTVCLNIFTYNGIMFCKTKVPYLRQSKYTTCNWGLYSQSVVSKVSLVKRQG